LGIAVVWLGVFLYAQQKGDWGTAFNFGATIGDCVSIVLVSALRA
jgi:hypothetical protein